MRCVAAIVLGKKNGPKVRIPPLPPPPAILPLSGHVLVCPQHHAKQKNSILKRILELCPDMYKLVTIFFSLLLLVGLQHQGAGWQNGRTAR